MEVEFIIIAKSILLLKERLFIMTINNNRLRIVAFHDSLYIYIYYITQVEYNYVVVNLLRRQILRSKRLNNIKTYVCTRTCPLNSK